MFDVKRVAAVLAASSVGLIAACSEAGLDPISPQQPDGIALGIRANSPGDNTLAAERFEVCKVWLGVTTPSDFSTTVTVDVTGGTTDNFMVTLTGDECREVWVNGGGIKDNVTVTESGPPNFTTAQTRTFILDGVGGGPDSGNSGAVDGDSGVLVVWTNELIPTGGEGCTPGYWKNHAGLPKPGNGKGLQFQPDSWPPTGFATGDGYDVTFAVVSSFGGTLLEALQRGGGGENALGRHAVAALLNAAHAGVDYDLTVAQVIAAVQAAYAGGDFESAKNLLASLNEQGCPL